MRLNNLNKINISLLVLCGMLLIGGLVHSQVLGASLIQIRAVQQALDIQEATQPTVDPNDLIRFHVLAHSDRSEDQALKRAVRDAILRQVSSPLAASASLEESRKILLGLRPEMETISKEVIRSWGKDYGVTTDYGRFTFPTKSYGSLVLPAGEYEAVRVLIGEAKGSNWWCVLFPPLCFVDVERSTAVVVDGKPGIPIAKTPSSQDRDGTAKLTKTVNNEKKAQEKPEVRFWLAEKVRELMP